MHDVPDSGFWFDMSLLRSIQDDTPATIDPSVLSAGFARNERQLAPAEPSSQCELQYEAYLEFVACVRTIERGVRQLVTAQTQFSSALNVLATRETCDSEYYLAEALRRASRAAWLTNFSKEVQSKIPQKITVTGESDISDDDNRQNFADLVAGMRRLSWNQSRQFLAVTGLKLCDRKQAHALAHVMGLSHITLGEEKTLLLSNNNELFTPLLKTAIRTLAKMNNTNWDPRECYDNDGAAYSNTSNNAQGTLSARQTQLESNTRLETVDLNRQNFTFGIGQSLRPRKARLNGGYSSGGSGASDGANSNASSGSGVKRRRQSRCDGAFVCHHDGCCERFDRQCDLTQHERSHLPHEQRPYGCESCGKRFLYPKDLRRHDDIHRNVAGVYDNPDDDCRDVLDFIKELEKAKAVSK